MSSRWQVEAALVASDLKPQQRHILLTLLTKADAKTGVIPAQHTPSLSHLEAMTGLARSTVAKELNALETAGWVDRMRPTVADARSKKERTRYRLRVPSSPRDGLEVVRTTDQKETSASPHHGPALVRVTDRSSPHHGLNKDLEPSSSSSRRAQTRIAAALEVEEEEADQIFNRIVAERRPAAPSRYVDSLIASGDIGQFRTTLRAVTTYAGPRCTYVAADNGTGECARCHMPRAHARHGGAA